MRGEVEELKTVLEQERRRRQEVNTHVHIEYIYIINVPYMFTYMYLLSSLPLCVHCLPPQSEASAMEKEVELTQALSRLGEYERVCSTALYCAHVYMHMHVQLYMN